MSITSKIAQTKKERDPTPTIIILLKLSSRKQKPQPKICIVFCIESKTTES